MGRFLRGNVETVSWRMRVSFALTWMAPRQPRFIAVDSSVGFPGKIATHCSAYALKNRRLLDFCPDFNQFSTHARGNTIFQQRLARSWGSGATTPLRLRFLLSSPCSFFFLFIHSSCSNDRTARRFTSNSPCSVLHCSTLLSFLSSFFFLFRFGTLSGIFKSRPEGLASMKCKISMTNLRAIFEIRATG